MTDLHTTAKALRDLDEIMRALEDENDIARGRQDLVAERKWKARVQRIRALAEIAGPEVESLAAETERLAGVSYQIELDRLRKQHDDKSARQLLEHVLKAVATRAAHRR